MRGIAARAPLSAFDRRRRSRLGAGTVRLELEQHFVVLDHAGLAARALLDCFEPGFQIAHIGVERFVSRLELFVGLALLRELAIVFAYLQPAALAEPHR